MEKNLNFIARLGEPEIVDLINWSIKSKKKYDENIRISEEINQVKIYAEEDRKDINGNRYIWVQTSNDALLLSNYIISDYYMRTEDYGNHCSYPSISYDEELRKFLSIRFGEEYLESLFSHHVEKARDECDILRCLIKDKGSLKKQR